jgi:hypothetical protein
MQATVTRTARILTGHRIELVMPELPEGAEVEITVTLAQNQTLPDLQSRFDVLVQQWKNDTRPLSSPTAMERHPAYQEIIGIGQAAVPLLLRDLQREPDFWFSALHALTGADPMLPEHQGKVIAIAADWIQWGKEHGYLSCPAHERLRQ